MLSPEGPCPASVPGPARAGPPLCLPLLAAEAVPLWRRSCLPPTQLVSLPLQTPTSARRSPTSASLAPAPTALGASSASVRLVSSSPTTGTVALVSLWPKKHTGFREEVEGRERRAGSPSKGGCCSFLCGSPGAPPGQRCSLPEWGYSSPDNMLARQVTSAKGYPSPVWADPVPWALVVL